MSFFVGQEKVGPKWRIFSQVTKIWADQNLRPTKIKGHFKNLFKREVINFLSTFVQKFTVLIWVKFEVERKQHDSDEKKEKTWKKTTFENDSDNAVPESVSKLNKIVSYDDTDSDS